MISAVSYYHNRAVELNKLGISTSSGGQGWIWPPSLSDLIRIRVRARFAPLPSERHRHRRPMDPRAVARITVSGASLLRSLRPALDLLVALIKEKVRLIQICVVSYNLPLRMLVMRQACSARENLTNCSCLAGIATHSKLIPAAPARWINVIWDACLCVRCGHRVLRRFK